MTESLELFLKVLAGSRGESFLCVKPHCGCPSKASKEKAFPKTSLNFFFLKTTLLKQSFATPCTHCLVYSPLGSVVKHDDDGIGLKKYCRPKKLSHPSYSLFWCVFFGPGCGCWTSPFLLCVWYEAACPGTILQIQHVQRAELIWERTGSLKGSWCISSSPERLHDALGVLP